MPESLGHTVSVGTTVQACQRNTKKSGISYLGQQVGHRLVERACPHLVLEGIVRRHSIEQFLIFHQGSMEVDIKQAVHHVVQGAGDSLNCSKTFTCQLQLRGGEEGRGVIGGCGAYCWCPCGENSVRFPLLSFANRSHSKKNLVDIFSK